MFGALRILVDRLPLGRLCCLAILVASLGMSGCESLNLRGERFADTELSNFARQIRQADGLGSSDAFTNRGRQIDQDLGGSRNVTPGSSL
jgi:hypothetical protein